MVVCFHIMRFYQHTQGQRNREKSQTQICCYMKTSFMKKRLKIDLSAIFINKMSFI